MLDLKCDISIRRERLDLRSVAYPEFPFTSLKKMMLNKCNEAESSTNFFHSWPHTEQCQAEDRKVWDLVIR